MTTRHTFKLAAAMAVLTLVLVGASACAPDTSIITLDPGIQYQTMSGWEATAQAGQVECRAFDGYAESVFDLAVDDLGIDRVRLELISGSENPIDYFAQLLDGSISHREWRPYRYQVINDNDDPQSTDPAGFHFTALDHTIDHVILPMKHRVEQNGETLYLNLTVVDFSGGTEGSNLEFQSAPGEYAELILAAFQHMQRKYGFVPDGIEVILEPDQADWRNGANVGRALAAAGARLEANGYTPEFIAPSTTSMGKAVSWFDQMITVDGVSDYLTLVSYHRYKDVSAANLAAIRQRAEIHHLETGMLEHIGSSYDDLHEDLKSGHNSAWQQYTLAFCTQDNGAQYYWIDLTNEQDPTVQEGKRTRYLRHYFKFIRQGAARVDAVSNSRAFDPVAFINRDDTAVVVVKANRGGSFLVSGLPSGTYGIEYTSAEHNGVALPEVSLKNGEDLTASIPSRGVITIHQMLDLDRHR